MIQIISGKAKSIDHIQTLGYLGVKSGESDDELNALINECEKAIFDKIGLKACYQTNKIAINNEEIDLGYAKTRSKSLAAFLNGCNGIVTFACTAGGEIDRLIKKYSVISPARAAVIQALGSVAVEQWCDEICAILQREYKTDGKRFSCGYGDLTITLQRDIFAALNVTKNIGITLNENCFMMPSKSVTAIVGIKN